MLFLCYPKCSTCQKAKKWLEENDISYSERNIARDNPTYDELKEWYEKSGLPLQAFPSEVIQSLFQNPCSAVPCVLKDL